jgi:alanyl-tRNA synthetase
VTALVKPTEFDAKAYRSAVERCVAESEDCLFVILSESAEEDKVSLLVGSSKNISKALSAKSVLAQLAAVIGGKGGGNDLVAQAGGNQRGKVEMVFKKAETL